jgi:hypothetical protein
MRLALLASVTLLACSGNEKAVDPGGAGASAGTPAMSGGAPADGGSAGMSAGGTPQSGGESGAPPSGGAGAGGSAGGGPTGQIGVVGAPCDSPGALACAGNYQKLGTVCGVSGMWEPNQTCEAGQFCDSSPGPNAGLCAAPAPECADKMPGDRFCTGRSLTQCGLDTLTVELVEECQFGCFDGACSPECPDNMILNCSDTCGGPSPECFDGCDGTSEEYQDAPLLVSDAVMFTLAPGTYVIRTGTAGRYQCACRPDSGNDQFKYALLFARLPYNQDSLEYSYGVRTQAPWGVSLIEPDGPAQPLCTPDSYSTLLECQALMAPAAYPRLVIGADELSAPPTDVFLEVFATATNDFCQ